MNSSLQVYESDIWEPSASGGDTTRTISYDESLIESELANAVEVFQALRRWKYGQDREQGLGGQT